MSLRLPYVEDQLTRELFSDIMIAVKNAKRFEILDIVSRSKSREERYNEVQEAIFQERGYGKGNRREFEHYYIAPLVRARLIGYDNDSIEITPTGLQVYKIIAFHPEIFKLPRKRAKGYEEILLLYLMQKRSYADLVRLTSYLSIHKQTLHRSLKRLEQAGFVQRRRFIYYPSREMIRRLEKNLSRKSKSILDKIPTSGMSARELSLKTGKNFRTIYQYLKRFEKLRLVRKQGRVEYQNTYKGSSLADALYQIFQIAKCEVRYRESTDRAISRTLGRVATKI